MLPSLCPLIAGDTADFESPSCFSECEELLWTKTQGVGHNSAEFTAHIHTCLLQRLAPEKQSWQADRRGKLECVSWYKRTPLASRNEAIFDIVIPIPVIALAYVVVVKSTLVIEAGKESDRYAK